jgi:hypothetical protein
MPFARKKEPELGLCGSKERQPPVVRPRRVIRVSDAFRSTIKKPDGIDRPGTGIRRKVTVLDIRLYLVGALAYRTRFSQGMSLACGDEVDAPHNGRFLVLDGRKQNLRIQVLSLNPVIQDE